MRIQYIRKEYDPLKVAYLAGIVDGEGSIYIGNFSCNPKTGAKYYQTNCQVTNTCKELIEWLHANFGGLQSKRPEHITEKYGQKPVFIWTASGELLTHLCELMLPFLVAKRKQCEIMLEMRATYRGTTKKGKQGIQPNSQELLDYRESLMQKMRSLHCRTFSREKK